MATKRLAIACIFLIACAASVPSKLPPTSAASEAAQAAPVPNVGIALREDPPLPGEKSAWAGLPGQSGDMGGMDMGGMTMPMGNMHMDSTKPMGGMDMGKADGGMQMPMGNMDGGMSHHAH